MLVSHFMITYLFPFGKLKGNSYLLPAYGREGQGQHLFSWRRISQSEIRNSAAEKSESESEGGQKFLPPNPLPFCPPERSVSAVPPTAGAIIRYFVQKRFELRSAIATKKPLRPRSERFFCRAAGNRTQTACSFTPHSFFVGAQRFEL